MPNNRSHDPNSKPNSQANSGTGSFEGLGIAPMILDILEQMGLESPTPIQRQAIPIAITGQDLMGIAQTGTGKTLAFGIPLLQRLAATNGSALVILPTRELAVQVNDSLKKLCKPLRIKTAVLIGGENISRQRIALRDRPQIVIATPGRLIDHLEQRNLRVDHTSILVLDEADRMLDMGFAPQVKKILETVPKNRQTMLFSATMPKEIVQIATSYMHMPMRVEVAPAGTTAAQVTQELFFVNKGDKLQLLESLLREYKGSVLIFSRTKHGAKKIVVAVRSMNHTAAEIHSNRTLNQRLEALNGFKVGKYRVLVATDIAARGIDVRGIEVVINYDLPENPDDYVHRIGRTGRAGHQGHAISLATPDQRRGVKDIERLIQKTLPVSHVPSLPPKRMVEAPEERPRNFGPRRPHGDRPRR